MALTDLERLRLAIADRPRVALREQVGVGDGVSTQFQTQLFPVVDTSETVLVNGVPSAAYALDAATGVLTFTSAPLSEAQIVATYSWSVFSDAELQDLLDQGVSVPRAAIQAIMWLLADSERFLKYTFGQESVDRSEAREGLERLLQTLSTSLTHGAVKLVLADSDYRKCLMSPFIQQECSE